MSTVCIKKCQTPNIWSEVDLKHFWLSAVRVEIQRKAARCFLKTDFHLKPLLITTAMKSSCQISVYYHWSAPLYIFQFIFTNIKYSRWSFWIFCFFQVGKRFSVIVSIEGRFSVSCDKNSQTKWLLKVSLNVYVDDNLKGALLSRNFGQKHSKINWKYQQIITLWRLCIVL